MGNGAGSQYQEKHPEKREYTLINFECYFCDENETLTTILLKRDSIWPLHPSLPPPPVEELQKLLKFEILVVCPHTDVYILFVVAFDLYQFFLVLQFRNPIQ
jgi:hypothetical protein